MDKELLDITDIFTRERAALAPLAGITNSVFRRICAGFGARPVVTEMVSADGYVRGKSGDKTESLLKFNDSERPIGLQFFGSDPDIMAEAVHKAQKLMPDFIDINAGCPTRKVTTKGCGAALLRVPDQLGRIVERVVCASTVPVTVKIRSGWDLLGINAVEVASICEGAGAQALIVHPRTRSQGFSGHADWTVIRDVKNAVSVPVIGSGDIITTDDAVSMFEQTGADAVMIGRGAKGNPWIFRQVMERMKGSEVSNTPFADERLEFALSHLDILVEETNERFAVLNFRKFIGWYSRGVSGGGEFCQRVYRAETIEAVRCIMSDFQFQLREHEFSERPNYGMVETKK